MGIHLPVTSSAPDPLRAAHDDLIRRTDQCLETLLQPLVDGLDGTHTFFIIESQVDATSDAGRIASEIALAVAQRERELAGTVEAIRDRVARDVATLREAACAPLSPLTAGDQFRFWVQEAIRAPGRRESFAFTETTAIAVSIDFIESQRELLKRLVIGFAQMAEDATYDLLVAEGLSPEEAHRDSRFAAEPSWRVFFNVSDVALTDDEGLGLVAIGTVLGLWEPNPPIERLEELTGKIHLADVPYLSPTPTLLGVVHA
jgi:hypothetical protein